MCIKCTTYILKPVRDNVLLSYFKILNFGNTFCIILLNTNCRLLIEELPDANNGTKNMKIFWDLLLRSIIKCTVRWDPLPALILISYILNSFLDMLLVIHRLLGKNLRCANNQNSSFKHFCCCPVSHGVHRIIM